MKWTQVLPLGVGVVVSALSVVTAVKDASSSSSSSSTFTPEDMLSAPRASPAIPSPDGKWALSVVTEWDFKKRRNHKAIFLVSLDSSSKSAKDVAPMLLLESTQTSSLSEPLWADDGSVLYLNATAGSSELWHLSIKDQIKSFNDVQAFEIVEPGVVADGDETFNFVTYKKHGSNEQQPSFVLQFPTEPSALKYLATPGKKTHHDGFLAFSAHLWAGESIESTEELNKAYAERPDEALLYDELYIREWDTWRVPEKQHHVVMAGIDLGNDKPKLQSSSSSNSSTKWVSPLNASGVVSDMNPFGADDYDIALAADGSVHLAAQIKAKGLNYAFHTRRNVYLAALDASSLDVKGSVKMLTSGEQGAVGSVRLSRDGNKVAWVEMATDGNESDRNQLVTYDIQKRERSDWTATWDRSPSSIQWAHDGNSVYMIAEHHGSALPYHLTHPGHLPTPLLFSRSTSSIQSLNDGRLLIAASSLTSPSEDFLLLPPTSKSQGGDGDKSGAFELHAVTSWSKHALKGKDLSKGEEFWFKGAENHDVMGWIVKPKGWKSNQNAKYPLAFLIHGGPEAAWEDSWSTRWNPNVFAQQGYFVVAINPTGSTGYGQDFVDGIRGNWGGRPFKDLVAGLHHVLDNHPEIDRSRMAALGGSYGGYMINWIAGHNSETNFTALVNHDGLFETHIMYYATEEVYFPEFDTGRVTPWEDRFAFEQWNPANHVGEWNTPMLVIQGGKDYRVPEYQSVSAFTALQRRGIPSRFLFFPSENHWVLNPQNSQRWHHEVLRWLDEWVGSKKDKVLESSAQQVVF